VSPCPRECRCSGAAQRCAPGVSLAPDQCGCCPACAGQLNDDCSRARPCDHAKGLTCNFGAGDAAATRGICRAKLEGRSCEYNDRIYQNGESFRPNCRHQCTCADAAVACVSLCPRRVALPKLGCEQQQQQQQQRLVRSPGRCCGEQPACVGEDGMTQRLLVEERGPRETQKPRNDLADDKDELALVNIGGYSPLAAFRREPEGRMLAAGPGGCQPQIGAWSTCSRSCGAGVSTRMSNSNSQCKLTKETRLCEVRPCAQTAVAGSKKKAAGRPVRWFHMGCGSVKTFQLRFCGSCSKGLCCQPHRTQTVPVRFRCEDGSTWTHNVMMIQSCKCEPNRTSGQGNAIH
ncbi:hypothetical protein CRUP_038555, partial [Coryphaenoides rupestris]